MDKTAEDFRAAHDERLQLIERWDETVQTLKKRDRTIDEANERLKGEKEKIRENEEQLRDLASALEAEKQKQKKLDAELQSSERALVRSYSKMDVRKSFQGALRFTCQNKERQTKETENELDRLGFAKERAQKDLIQKQKENQSASERLQSLRWTKTRSFEECCDRDSVEQAIEKFATSKVQIEEEKNRLEKIEFKDDGLRNRLKAEERKLKEIEKEIHDLKQNQSRKAQILFEEKKSETDFISAISGIAFQDRNLKSKILSIDEEVDLFVDFRDVLSLDFETGRAFVQRQFQNRYDRKKN